jgi:hypothetical protein
MGPIPTGDQKGEETGGEDEKKEEGVEDPIYSQINK